MYLNNTSKMQMSCRMAEKADLSVLMVFTTLQFFLCGKSVEIWCYVSLSRVSNDLLFKNTFYTDESSKKSSPACRIKEIRGF